jgi:hypothetical protein
MPTRQGTAYCVPQCRVGRTFPVARLRPPLITADLLALRARRSLLMARTLLIGSDIAA